MQIAVDHFHFGGKRGLRPIGQRCQHLTGLVAIVVNRLLAQNDHAGLLFVCQRFEQFGHSQGLQFFGGFHQNATVSAYGHGSAQSFLALGDAAGDNDDFCQYAFFFQPHRFFHSDFIERVHAHFDVGDIDAGLVRFDPDFDVVIHHALDGDQCLHGFAPRNKYRLKVLTSMLGS